MTRRNILFLAFLILGISTHFTMSKSFEDEKDDSFYDMESVSTDGKNGSEDGGTPRPRDATLVSAGDDRIYDITLKMSKLKHQIAALKHADVKLRQQNNKNRGMWRRASYQIKALKRQDAQFRKQINDNKCQSGVVKSYYTTKPNMNSVQRVTFKRRFRTVPNVVIGLKVFDSYYRHNARLSTHVYRVTRSGFNIRITSWAGTTMYQAHYFWMACP